VTLSYELGRIGLLERENATLLSAALVDLARRTTNAFAEASPRRAFSLFNPSRAPGGKSRRRPRDGRSPARTS